MVILKAYIALETQNPPCPPLKKGEVWEIVPLRHSLFARGDENHFPCFGKFNHLRAYEAASPPPPFAAERAARGIIILRNDSPALFGYPGTINLNAIFHDARLTREA
jgi:hypothetical protein